MNHSHLSSLIDISTARGLEVGPLTRPVIPKALGPVEYVDRASTDELRRWYANDPNVDISKIVDIDHVWGSNSLLECVKGQRVYDYLIASHVIEHVPDLFGWLKEVASVLVDGGVACFAVPDKRYTFDVMRRISSASEIVDAFVRNLRRPDPRQIFDHFANIRDVDTSSLHNGTSPTDLPPKHAIEAVFGLCNKAVTTGEYIDSHCWVFTPFSFLDALELGTRLGLLPFAVEGFFDTPKYDNEFVVLLKRLPDGIDYHEPFLASRKALRLSVADYDTALLENRAQAAEAELEAVRQSTSWKITAPLRHASTMIRKAFNCFRR